MKSPVSGRMGIVTRTLALVLAGVTGGAALVSGTAGACTIFVLTDTNHTLFCNNEDWSDARTRIWFLPAGSNYFGAVYVGFINGWAQGGMNTAGLAYDWVADGDGSWTPDPQMGGVRGNPSQRMLETCTTVNDAIAFYRKYREPGFETSRILLADRSGASAIIGVTNGQLQMLPETHCRGFGFGHRILEAALATNSAPTVTNGFKILRDCRQTGFYATKYSNIYDLKTGDIFLYPLPDRDDEVTLNLTAELKKGPHYYEMLEIQSELAGVPRALPLNMERFPLDHYQPIPDREPEVTMHVRAMVEDLLQGSLHREDFTDQVWPEVVRWSRDARADMEKLGNLVSMTLVDRSETNGLRTYRYQIEFDGATVLQRVILTADGKWVSGGAEAVEPKPGALHRMPLVGIGVQLRADSSNIVVQAIIPGSPAAHQKDLRAGDRVLAVAQEIGPAVPVVSGQIRQAVAVIRGAEGTIVRLTVVSPDEPESSARVVSLVRANLEPLIQ